MAQRQRWFVIGGAGQILGPFGGGDLKMMAAAGDIERTSQVRLGDYGRWVTADAVGGLFQSPPLSDDDWQSDVERERKPLSIEGGGQLGIRSTLARPKKDHLAGVRAIADGTVSAIASIELRRYKGLKVLRLALQVAGFFMIACGIGAGFGGVFGPEMMAAVVVVIVGLIASLPLFVLANFIDISLSVEDSARRTVELLEIIAQRSPADETARAG